jgi:hypothetical protein
MNLAPGGTIVILSIAILLGTIGAKSIAKSIRYRSRPTPKQKSLARTT